MNRRHKRNGLQKPALQTIYTQTINNNTFLYARALTACEHVRRGVRVLRDKGVLV